jgi:outer membrane beta-barrel protein
MFPRTLTIGLCLCALAARAEDAAVYGPDGAPTVVQRKLYTMTGRTEVGLAGGLAVNNALVNQAGGLLSISYHPNEWLDGGVDLLFNATGLSQLARNVRANLASTRSSLPLRDELRNDNQLRYGALAAARIAPIYGKINLASELRIHFQAFLLAGAGFAMVHRESVNVCADGGTSPVASCSRFETSDSVPVVGEIGAGLRFYVNDRWSLRTEARGFFFQSSYRTDTDPTVPGSGTERSYLAAVADVLIGVSRTF